MQRINHSAAGSSSDFPYWGLYKTGATASLLAAFLFRRNLDAEWMLLRSMGLVKTGPIIAPKAIEEWFVLLHQHPLLGLTLLNLFDLVNYALVGLIFLALVAALWKISPSRMLVAAGCTMAAVNLNFASNQAFSLLSLSQQYATSADESRRAAALSAGQALMAIHHHVNYGAPGAYLSFLLVSFSGLLIAWSMGKSSIFGKASSVMGILANGFQLSYYIVLLLAPSFIFIPISISAIFLLGWYILIGVRLWSLGANSQYFGAQIIRMDAVR